MEILDAGPVKVSCGGGLCGGGEEKRSGARWLRIWLRGGVNEVEAKSSGGFVGGVAAVQ